ncbi:O-antigen ligase family protein [Candidatus Parcubacteria bacterium]|nr:O-antigen ligase family protein [Candidatus Parcubacteria bacterium]
MFLSLKKINLEYFGILTLAIAAGLMISFYNLSVLFILASILFVIISFKYFNQVLFLLILYIPFQVALNISAGIDLASGRVLILYLFAVWIIRSLAEKKFIIRFNLQTLLIGAFLVLALFSMLQAWDMGRAFRKILVFLSIFPLYFIITSLSIPSLYKVGTRHCLVPTIAKRRVIIKNKNNYIYKILNTLIVSGFILSLIGIAQFLLQFFIGIDPIIKFWSMYISPIFYGNTFGAEVITNPSWLVNIGGVTILRAFSLFPDPHMFSFYLGLLIPVVLAIVLVGKNNSICHSEFSSESIYRTGRSATNKGLIGFQFLKQIIKKIGELCGYRRKILKQVQNDNLIQNNKHTFFNSKLLYLILFIMLLAELLTFSRGGYIGMIAGIGVTIILLWRYINFNKKIILGLVAGISVLFIMFSNQSIINRFLSSFDFDEGSNTERIKNWNQGWEIFSDNFFTGVGIGNYSIYLYPTVEYRTPIYAHNLYLDIGAEMGIFALLVWLALIGITIWQLFKTGEKSKDAFSRALSFGLVGSLIWFSTHSFFDTSIYSPTILAVFVIIVSISVMIIKVSSIKY